MFCGTSWRKVCYYISFIKISSVLCLFSFPLFLTSKTHSAISFYYFIIVIRLGSSLNLVYENLGGVNGFTFTLRMIPVMAPMVRGSVETPCWRHIRDYERFIYYRIGVIALKCPEDFNLYAHFVHNYSPEPLNNNNVEALKRWL